MINQSQVPPTPPTPVILIRPAGFGHGDQARFFTAVGELEDVTWRDEVLSNSTIIDCGEVKAGETPRAAAARKRAKYKYEERPSCHAYLKHRQGI